MGLGCNQIKGNIPISFGLLNFLLINNNINFEVKLPPQLYDLRELQLIEFSQNNLYDKISSCLSFIALCDEMRMTKV